jgi:hypothetical protein
MKVKKYKDGTFNIFYEVGDMVKVVDNDKYSTKKSENIGKWGEIVKMKGNPVTAKLTIDVDGGQIEEFVWNVIPSDESGNEIPSEDLDKIQPVREGLRIKRFDEFKL